MLQSFKIVTMYGKVIIIQQIYFLLNHKKTSAKKIIKLLNYTKKLLKKLEY